MRSPPPSLSSLFSHLPLPRQPISLREAKKLPALHIPSRCSCGAALRTQSSFCFESFHHIQHHHAVPRGSLAEFLVPGEANGNRHTFPLYINALNYVRIQAITSKVCCQDYLQSHGCKSMSGKLFQQSQKTRDSPIYPVLPSARQR